MTRPTGTAVRANHWTLGCMDSRVQGRRKRTMGCLRMGCSRRWRVNIGLEVPRPRSRLSQTAIVTVSSVVAQVASADVGCSYRKLQARAGRVVVLWGWRVSLVRAVWDTSQTFICSSYSGYSKVGYVCRGCRESTLTVVAGLTDDSECTTFRTMVRRSRHTSVVSTMRCWTSRFLRGVVLHRTISSSVVA